MQITFDQERLQRPPSDVLAPYIERTFQFQYTPCPGAVYDFPLTEVALLDTGFEHLLQFDESTLEEIQLVVDNLVNREQEPEDALLAVSGVLQQLVDRALQEEAPSPDWERELDEL